MKRAVFTGILFAISAMFLIISCSDDDSGTPPDQGNLDDPTFQFMDVFLGDGMNKINLLSIEKMSYMIDSVIDNEVPKAQYNITYVPGGYTEENNWYVFDDSMHVTATDSDEADSIFYSGTDSLGFVGGGALMAPPVLANMDSLLLRCGGNYMVYAETSTMLDMDYSAAFKITAEAFGVDTITVNGTAEFTITGDLEFDDNDVCEITMTLTVIYTNFKFDWTDDLVPYEGNASATAVITQTCESGSSAPDISGTWTATWTLGNGSVTNTFHHGEDTWVYTETLD